MEIKEKVFLITGAGNGIGKELVLALIKKGAKVGAVDIREDSLNNLKNEVEAGSSLKTYVLDLSKKEDILDLPKKVVSDFGAIDGIINNAGIIQQFVKINDIDYEDAKRVMDINFYGTLYITKSFLPLLLKRPEASIVNVSSMGGFLPVPGQSIYGASKAAIKLMTEGLRAELLDTNIKVTIVFPGATETSIASNSGIKNLPQQDTKSNFPMLSAKEVANKIVIAIEKGTPQLFTGKDSNMMNIFYRLNPVFAANLIAKMMKSLLADKK